MTPATIEYTYRYTKQSDILFHNDVQTNVVLSTFSNDSNPYFFESKLVQPMIFAEALLCLAKIIRTHFFDQRSGLLDPVVTCGDGKLRFEGFSGCCGVHVQTVFDSDAFSQPITGHGTTNVDINEQLRNGLVGIKNDSDVELSVGRDELKVNAGDEQFVEKNVKLPLRWLRSFCEVQSYLSRSRKYASLSAYDALQFVRKLPRDGGRKLPIWAVPSGRTLRVTSRQTKDSIRISGTERLRSIEPLLRVAKGKLTIWADDETGVSTWGIDLGTCQFLITLSPELYRGFSGEGQVLEHLADESWKNAIDLVRSKLSWQGTLELEKLAIETGLSSGEIRDALNALATRGLVGYDVVSNSYYHRELPFQSGLVESLQPRLIAARKLVTENKVRRNQALENGEQEWIISGSDVEHFVVLSDHRQDRCTCVWFSKHQGKRGPCKHVLAARIKSGDK